MYMYICTQLCMYVCMYVYICIYIYHAIYCYTTTEVTNPCLSSHPHGQSAGLSGKVLDFGPKRLILRGDTSKFHYHSPASKIDMSLQKISFLLFCSGVSPQKKFGDIPHSLPILPRIPHFEVFLKAAFQMADPGPRFSTAAAAS